MKGGSLENDLRLQYLIVVVLGRIALDKISTVDELLDCVLDVFPMTFYSQLREHTTPKAGKHTVYCCYLYANKEAKPPFNTKMENGANSSIGYEGRNRSGVTARRQVLKNFLSWCESAGITFENLNKLC